MNTQLISSELNTASSFHICIFHFQNKRERKRERNCSAFLIRQTNGTHTQTETWLKTNTEAVSWWHGPSITRSHSKSKGTSFLRHLSHAVTMSLVFFFLFFSLSPFLPPFGPLTLDWTHVRDKRIYPTVKVTLQPHTCFFHLVTSCQLDFLFLSTTATTTTSPSSTTSFCFPYKSIGT